MTRDQESPETFNVLARDRAPLIAFMVEALRADGCRIIHQSQPNRAPFRITFESSTGERMGIVVYAFRMPFTPTTNLPDDEHMFQIRYDTKDGKEAELWQDPSGLYVTLFLGVNVELGLCVSLDPVLMTSASVPPGPGVVPHGGVATMSGRGWFAWEWEPEEGPIQVLVGVRRNLLLDCVRFESVALGADPGHRQLLAERFLWRK